MWRAGLPCLAAALLALAACGTSDDEALQQTIAAQAQLDAGQPWEARRLALKAIDARDDLPDVWLLLARIHMTLKAYGPALDAYAHVLELDARNAEALTLVAQLGLATGRLDQADAAADQLLGVDPSNRIAGLVKAGVALRRRDRATASAALAQILTADPNDAEALYLQSQLVRQEGSDNDTAAAALLERSLAAGGDPGTRLPELREIAVRRGDRAGLTSALSRMAALPDAPSETRLDYAALLYDEGQAEAARAAVAGAMRADADSLKVAAAVLELWRDAGVEAISAERMSALAEGLSPLMRATVARRAVDLGRPDQAMALVAPAMGSGVPMVQVARAEALLAGGRAAEARAVVAAILEADADQPEALALRARLSALSGDLRGAVGDLRHAVSSAPGSATLRIALADTLLRSGQATLAEGALREGMRAIPGNVRLAGALTRFLVRQGRTEAVGDVIGDLVAAAPLSRRAAAFARRTCSGTPGLVCAPA